MRPKIVLFVAFLTTLFNGVEMLAQSSGSNQGPPVPNTNRAPGPPVEARLPIDDNIIILLVAGFALGIYYVCFLKESKKRAA